MRWMGCIGHTASMVLFLLGVSGCSDDDAGTKASDTGNSEPDTEVVQTPDGTDGTGCEGGASCCTCDSDLEVPATCEGNTWTCPQSSFICTNKECKPEDVPDCSLYNGELCCTDEGPVSAKCPVPSEPYCLDNSEPKMSCVQDSEGKAVTCDNVVELFTQYVAANSACSADSDCTAIGGAETCDCTAVLVSGSGSAIAKTAAADAAVYFDVYHSELCKSIQMDECDSAPAVISCNEGQCVAVSKSCLAPPPADQ